MKKKKRNACPTCRGLCYDKLAGVSDASKKTMSEALQGIYDTEDRIAREHRRLAGWELIVKEWAIKNNRLEYLTVNRERVEDDFAYGRHNWHGAKKGAGKDTADFYDIPEDDIV